MIEFILKVAEIITAITIIMGAVVTVEKKTHGRIQKWLFVPILNRIDNIEGRILSLENDNRERLQEIKMDNLKQIIMNEAIPLQERIHAR